MSATYPAHRRHPGPADADDFTDPAACVAHGCPLKGSVDLGGAGRFHCSAHAWAKPQDWPQITRELHEHGWLRDFITDLQMRDSLVIEAAWRGYAAAFWADSDAFMAPRPAETKPLYLERLHLELLHRIGSRQKRPEPRQPAAPMARLPGAIAEALPQMREAA